MAGRKFMGLFRFNIFTANEDNPYKLPSQYKFLKVLGEGGFGRVLKCLRKDTQDIVAVKIPLHCNVTTNKEISILQNMMHHKLDQHNIVKFYDWFPMSCGKALVFETLDISLEDYIHLYNPICLSDIRVIIQQVATAFDALKGIRLIHTDIKPDNIMLVNHQMRPLRVKVIDFGLAMPSSNSKQGMRLQTVYYRSPEIILGLPFSEAIDMWSLGCVLAVMILRFVLFPGQDEYEALKFMVELLGQPADHLMNNGSKTLNYFNKIDPNGWKLKTPEEHWGNNVSRFRDRRRYTFRSLDYLKRIRCEDSYSKATDWEKCIELLKAMLKLDEAERITPSQVLTHPFIAKGRHNRRNEASAPAATQPFKSQAQTKSKEPMKKTSFKESLVTHVNKMSRDEALACLTPPKDDTNILPDHHSPSSTIPRSVVIMVRPAAPENRVELENEGNATSLVTHVNKMLRDEALACLTPLKDDTTIHPDHHSPSPTIPRSVVIMVRPAAPENRVELENEGNATSLQAGLNKMSESSRKVTGSDTTASISEDSTTHYTTSDDTGTTKEKKKKKKKNHFRRFFSWMQKTLCSCWTCVEEGE